MKEAFYMRMIFVMLVVVLQSVSAEDGCVKDGNHQCFMSYNVCLRRTTLSVKDTRSPEYIKVLKIDETVEEGKTNYICAKEDDANLMLQNSNTMDKTTGISFEYDRMEPYVEQSENNYVRNVVLAVVLSLLFAIIIIAVICYFLWKSTIPKPHVIKHKIRVDKLQDINCQCATCLDKYEIAEIETPRLGQEMDPNQIEYAPDTGHQ